MIPLYGFVEGDTLGLVILADPAETIASLAEKLQSAASVRVAPRAGVRVFVGDRAVDPKLTVAAAGLSALDRFDVREASES